MNGYLALIIYCIITAISVLSIHDVTQKADPTVSMLYTFIVAVLIFHLLNIRSLPKLYQACLNNWKTVLWINISTAFVWFGTFWGLKYITPALFITIFMGTTPVVSALINIWQEKEVNAITIIFIVMIILLFIALSIIQQEYQPHQNNYFLGLFLAILGGGVLSWYLFVAKILHEKAHLAPTQVLAIRFHLAILLGLLFSLYHPSLAKYVTGMSFWYIIFLSLVSLVLPLYFSQMGLHKVGALKTAYIFPLTPVFTYILELFYGMRFNIYVLGLIVMLSLTLIFAARLKR